MSSSSSSSSSSPFKSVIHMKEMFFTRIMELYEARPGLTFGALAALATSSVFGLLYMYRGRRNKNATNNNNKNNNKTRHARTPSTTPLLSREERPASGIRLVDVTADRQRLFDLCFADYAADDEDIAEALEDHSLLGHKDVGPYIDICPETSFVLADNNGVPKGYALVALDADRFIQKTKQYYLPQLRKEYQYPNKDPEDFTMDEMLIQQFHYPEFTLESMASGTIKQKKQQDTTITKTEYPSSMRFVLEDGCDDDEAVALLQHVLDDLKKRQSVGVHIEMSLANKKLEGFLRMFGFNDIIESKYARVMGKKLVD